MSDEGLYFHSGSKRNNKRAAVLVIKSYLWNILPFWKQKSNIRSGVSVTEEKKNCQKVEYIIKFFKPE